MSPSSAARRARRLPRLRLRTQVLLLQCAVVACALATAFAAFAWLNVRSVNHNYQLRALAVARSVAAQPGVRADAARWSRAHLRAGGGAEHHRAALAAGPAQQAAEAARARTGSLFVVVTDDRGIRIAHPERNQLGRKVSTDPSRALAGHEVLARDRAHLGEEVVAKVPVYAPGSRRVVGEANAGMAASDVRAQVERVLGAFLGYLAVALLLGVAASALLARRWKRLTLGLEPEELVGLVQEQEAVLHGVGEGVLAVDPDGTVTVVNDEARRLLAVDPAPGARVGELGLTPRLLAAAREPTGAPFMAAVGERVLVVSSRAVGRDGRDLGTLLTVKDRTDVELLARQLDAVQAMSSALRAQRHEFANRLHVVSGLVHGGHTREAADYIDTLLGAGGANGPAAGGPPGLDAVGDAYLRVFLAAKAAQAQERGVRLELGGATWIDRPVAAPVDATTVLGNLIDNAVDAAAEGSRAPARVEVELMAEGDALLAAVADTGDGLPGGRDGAEEVFREGASTKDHAAVVGGRGVGLALARQIARARGGEVRAAEPGSPGPAGDGDGHRDGDGERVAGGAVFVARLPRVMAEGAQE